MGMLQKWGCHRREMGEHDSGCAIMKNVVEVGLTGRYDPLFCTRHLFHRAQVAARRLNPGHQSLVHRWLESLLYTGKRLQHGSVVAITMLRDHGRSNTRGLCMIQT